MPVASASQHLAGRLELSLRSADANYTRAIGWTCIAPGNKRHDAELTQAQVAERTGTHPPAAARLERALATGAHSPSPATLRKYAEGLRQGALRISLSRGFCRHQSQIEPTLPWI